MSGDAKRRFEYFTRRRAELEREAEKNGKLRRSDWWRLEYFKDPYLIDSVETDLHKRYQDISGNLLVLTREGKIGALMDNNRDIWMSRIQHIQEELFGRGLRPQRADNELHFPKPTFPDVPPGLRILRGRSLPARQYLVKVGRAEHMKDMLETGEVRISPVASYADKTLTAAIFDDELELIARYSFFNRDRTRLSRSAAASTAEQSGEIIARRTLPNFYVYCLTYHYDHRLLDDFHADAVVIIKSPITFVQKVIDATKVRLSDFQSRLGQVQYYDPYGVDDWNPESDGFLKHFRYAYQREFRIRWQQTQSATDQLKPFFVSIGGMHDYAELLTL